MKPFYLLVFLLAGLSGCASTPAPPPQANDPSFAPIIPDYPKQKLDHDGALFDPTIANTLYSDIRAGRVGDIITVQLRENTNATKAANTTTSKESVVEIDPIIGLGANPVALGGDSLEFDLDSSNEFTGDAQSNQSNSLFGDISVTVVQVLPNNNLVIRGEKWMTLNKGDEYIRLTGIIRAADISPLNTIQSNRIANARIQYSGTGSFARAQEKGWLAQFFDSKWWPL